MRSPAPPCSPCAARFYSGTGRLGSRDGRRRHRTTPRRGEKTKMWTEGSVILLAAGHTLGGAAGRRNSERRLVSKNSPCLPRKPDGSRGNRTCPGPEMGPRRARQRALASTDSAGLAKHQFRLRGPQKKTTAPNANPGIWPTNRRHSGAENTLFARSEASWIERRKKGKPKRKATQPQKPQRQAFSGKPADPIFSRSRRAQISAASRLLPQVLPACGAMRRILRLNLSPYEGRRRKGTLRKRPPGAPDNRFECPQDESPAHA